MFIDAGMITCPFCSEQIEVDLDPSEASSQQFVYDCEVCCRPIMISLQYGEEGELLSLSARPEND
jgi:hypothetical protein